MNYFAHGFRFIDDPYFLAGTAVPDWLSVVDRRVRARSKNAALLIHDADPVTAALARGVVQHHEDDAAFHQSRAFAELSLQLAVLIRDSLPIDDGFRPSFLGHILVEIMLDALLIAENADRLEHYYDVLERADPVKVQDIVNRMASRSTDKLAWFVGAFHREGFLWDYLDDTKLVFRLNQVMRRVRLAALPPDFEQLLPPIRNMVENRADELLFFKNAITG